MTSLFIGVDFARGQDKSVVAVCRQRFDGGIDVLEIIELPRTPPVIDLGAEDYLVHEREAQP